MCVCIYIYTLFNSKALNHFMTVCIISASEIVCVGLSNLRNSFQFFVFLSLFLMHEDFHKQMNDRREKSKIVVSTV